MFLGWPRTADRGACESRGERVAQLLELRGDECGGRRPPEVTGGSSLPFPVDGERETWGLGVVTAFLTGLLLLLWTPLTGELLHENDCFLLKATPPLGEDGATCLGRSACLSEGGRWEARGEEQCAGLPSLDKVLLVNLLWLRERGTWSLLGPSFPTERPLSVRDVRVPSEDPVGGLGFSVGGSEERSRDWLRARGVEKHVDGV